MLRQLLNLIVERETVSGSELARELGVSPTLIKQMIEELVCQGYLYPMTQGNSTPCERCPLRATCLTDNRPRVFALTVKGGRILTAETRRLMTPL